MKPNPDKLTNCAVCSRLFFPKDLRWVELVVTQPILVCESCLCMHTALKPEGAELPEDDPEFWQGERGDR